MRWRLVRPRKTALDRSIVEEVDEKVVARKRPKSVSVKTALVYAGELAPMVWSVIYV